MWGHLALKPFEGLLLTDKMTIFTGSKHDLRYLKMVALTFLNNEFSWTYILVVYFCHGNSIQLKRKKKDTVWVKE
jgi:hypothetical protein